MPNTLGETRALPESWQAASTRWFIVLIAWRVASIASTAWGYPQRKLPKIYPDLQNPEYLL